MILHYHRQICAIKLDTFGTDLDYVFMTCSTYYDIIRHSLQEIVEVLAYGHRKEWKNLIGKQERHFIKVHNMAGLAQKTAIYCNFSNGFTEESKFVIIQNRRIIKNFKKHANLYKPIGNRHTIKFCILNKNIYKVQFSSI